MDIKIIKDFVCGLKKNIGDKNLINTEVKKFTDNNQEIVKKYSGIFNVLKEGLNSESYNRLIFMLDMAISVKNKDLNEHDASVSVGQRLVDDIVKPQLKK